MTRWFNTAGPCQADIHYMLPATARLPNVLRIVKQRGYFVLPAQSWPSICQFAEVHAERNTHAALRC
ncbi:MAG: hypothetical protein AAFR30_14445, partial [Cyanobacteria bacterium J06628_4]